MGRRHLKMEVLDPLPFDLDRECLQRELQVERTRAQEAFRSAFEMARDRVTGMAGYAVQYVEDRTKDGVVIGGISFQSRVLRKNLEYVGRVFPYAVTIGPALEEEVDHLEDLLEKYYLDAIGNAALFRARKALEDALRSRFSLDGLAFMSPGSLKDWPIQEQKPLFSLLDGVARAVGVELTENCLMIPKKSVSGIYFPTETAYYNCQLCPLERCAGRKAPYSPELAQVYGIANNRKEA